MHRLSYSSGGLPDRARSALSRAGAIYLEGVKSDRRLLRIAADLGEIIEPGVGMAAGLHDGRLYSVAVRDLGRGEVDQHGNVIRSTTHLSFALHTDGYNRPDPPRYVLLLRTDASQDQTLSYVSDSARVLPSLSANTVRLMVLPLFSSALGPLRLLEPAGEQDRLRFNPEEIRNWSQRLDVNPPLGEDAKAAVAELADGLKAAQETLTIEPGACLVLDNWRVCHGRAAMSPTSRRVLQRAWVA